MSQTWREKIVLQLTRKRTELKSQGITDEYLEKALRNATRPPHTYGYVYRVWCQEVNLLFHPAKLNTRRGRKAARELELLEQWNRASRSMGGVAHG